MMRNTLCLLLSLVAICSTAATIDGKNLVLSTKNTSLLLDAQPDRALRFLYYGDRISDAQVRQVRDAHLDISRPAYPAFGQDMMTEVALQVTHADGNPTLDLRVKAVEQTAGRDGSLTTITLADNHYPFQLRVFYRTREAEDVIEQWTEISHTEKKAVRLNRFDSGYMPVRRGQVWAMHMHGGAWSDENNITEQPLNDGMLSIHNLDGSRNGHSAQAQVMLSLDGKPDEQQGRVIAASLCWSGNYEVRVDTETKQYHEVYLGIHPLASSYVLDAKKVLETPKVVWTYSTQGVGGASRNLHRWARAGGMHGGDRIRPVLLNSWEGVTFGVTEEKMFSLIDDIANLGGEMFVMDDGWFGDKYPRNNGSQGLGDWVVDKTKLPNGVEALTNRAKQKGIRFGIWIEPEACNTKSELYEKHPDWVLRPLYRDMNYGRGGTQVLLDLTNPAVQDHVFNLVDRLMQENPDIAYFKWDANVNLRNYGSSYLDAAHQTNLYVDYHHGLEAALKRIRDKYPDLIIQACGGGGGRVCYGILPYFDEFWVSDNTDAIQRIFMQWGTSLFYPSMCMAQHVGVMPNHQTRRTLPIKFRFDVAMTGRLGLELLPDKMTKEEYDYSRKTIAEYKQFRDIVQLGDQYRLVSPYSGQGLASVMYVTSRQDRAVLFAFKFHHWYNQPIPRFRLAGLDPARNYRIAEQSVPEGRRPSDLSVKSVSGALLMNQGIELPLGDEYSSRVYTLTAE